MSTLFRRLEAAANVATVIAAILLVAVLIGNHRRRPPADTAPKGGPSEVRAGVKLPVPGVEWGAGERTLVMALSTGCHFCTDSAPFYQRLAQERAKNPNLRLVAVFPQAVAQGQEYLNRLGVSVDDVRQAQFAPLGVSGTPTLIVANREGLVEASWQGRLSGEKEAEVLQRLR
ncbi:MAG: hypothetical protein JOZ96_01410 [Acidobacteria bacterium]|nr:hypothetical protein [Acidobacteriota bacterium]